MSLLPVVQLALCPVTSPLKAQSNYFDPLTMVEGHSPGFTFLPSLRCSTTIPSEPTIHNLTVSPFPAVGSFSAYGVVRMCTLYLNPCFSSHADTLQGLICCCLSPFRCVLTYFILIRSSSSLFFFLKRLWSATTQGQMNGRMLPKWMSHIMATQGRCMAVICIFQVRGSKEVH